MMSGADAAKAGILQTETGRDSWTHAEKIWYEMHVKLWWQELAMVGMRVLSQRETGHITYTQRSETG